MPWLSLSRPRFIARLVCVAFMVDILAVGQGFLWVLKCSLITIIPPMLHAH